MTFFIARYGGGQKISGAAVNARQCGVAESDHLRFLHLLPDFFTISPAFSPSINGHPIFCAFRADERMTFKLIFVSKRPSTDCYVITSPCREAILDHSFSDIKQVSPRTATFIDCRAFTATNFNDHRSKRPNTATSLRPASSK